MDETVAVSSLASVPAPSPPILLLASYYLDGRGATVQTRENMSATSRISRIREGAEYGVGS
jgi:hypothetical protein